MASILSKAKCLLVLTLLFLTGCATDRLVEVNTARIEVESPKSNGITPTLAVDLFHDVADQLGFVVKGPIQVSQTEFEHSANAPGKRPTNRTWLVMFVDKEHIRFISRIYGTVKDFAAAQSSASLFERALDKRGVQYTVSTRKAFIPP